jgi:molybdopterin converting factor small subunit
VKVRILQLGRKVMDYEGPEGSSIAAALEALSITAAQGMDLRVNSNTATIDTALREGDVVTIIPRIKGGSDRKR